MKKKEDPMPRNKLAFVRVYVDPEAVLQLARMADTDGRTKQRQMGLILEAAADLYRRDPQKLLDLLEDHSSARHGVAAA